MNGNTSFELEIEPDDEIGTIIVIQKDGVDGGSFPLITGQTQWWIGRSPESDIQLKKTGVIDRHCVIEQHNDKLTLIPYGPVYVNGSAIASQTPTKNVTPSKQAVKRKTIRHKDVLEIAKRSFRIEYPSGHPMTVRRRSSIVKQLSDETTVAPVTKSPGMRARDSMAVTTPLSLANVVKRNVNGMNSPAQNSPGSVKKRRTSSATDMAKPRRVTFGRALSPEIFDYRRPPSTPIRKGTTPIRCESSKRSIIKPTPLKTMREDDQKTPVKDLAKELNLSSFQLSPSPEPSDEKKDFVEIEPVSGGGTPSKRRRSSVFKPKKLSMSDETPPRRRRTMGGGGGGLTPQKRLQIKMKRLSANPVELEKAIKMYGNMMTKRLDEFGIPYNKKDDNKENKLPMPIVQPTVTNTVQRVEVASLGDMRKTAAANVNELNLDALDTPCTKFAKRMLAEDENEVKTEDMIKSTEEFSFLQESTPVLGSAKKSISIRSRLSVDTGDLLNSTRGDDDFDETDVNVSLVANPTDSIATASDSTLATAANETKTPSQGAITEAPDATKGMKTPGQTAMKGLFNEETVQHEPKTPNQAAMKTLFKETTENTSKTPGQTAMKGLFAEEKESCVKTPNQGAMKDLFKETAQPVTHQTPGQTAMKGLFAEDDASKNQPKTPNQAAMKTLFKDADEQSGAKTPGQTAMKGLFAEEKESCVKTPNQDAMKKLFKETTDSITHQTPGQTAMKGLFTEQDSNDETASSPNQGAMKKLFNQSAAPASPVMEKTVLQGVFAENDETEQPSTVESIFKGMADKSFSHYTTPSKKTPFESDQDINWPSRVLRPVDEHEPVVISTIDFENGDDMDGMDVLIQDACKDNYMLATLFAEKGSSHDESLVCEPGELMMEIMFGEHAAISEVEIDPEISFSTQSIANHIATHQQKTVDDSDEEQEQETEEQVEDKPRSTRKAAPRVKVQLGVRRSTRRSMETMPEKISSPPKKASRRTTKKKEEEDQETTQVDEDEQPRQTRTRKASGKDKEAVEPKPAKKTRKATARPPAASEPVEEMEEPKPKRRGRAAKQVVDDDQDDVVTKEETEPEEKPKRRGRAKKVTEEVKETAAVEKDPAEKPKRRGRAKKVDKEEEEEPVPPEIEQIEEANEEAEKPKPVRKKAAPKTKLSKTGKLLASQKNKSDKAKQESIERCADDFDVGQVPEIIMEEVETKSIVRRGRSKAAPANRVQFNSSDENPAKDEEEIEAQVEEAPVEKQKRKTTRAKKVTEKVTEAPVISSEETPPDEEAEEEKPKRKTRTKKTTSTTTKAETKAKPAKRATKDDESVESEVPKRSRKKASPVADVAAEPKRSTRSSARLKK